MWLLSVMILIKFGSGFLTGDHNLLTTSLRLSLWITFVCFWWKMGVLKGQTKSVLIYVDSIAACTLRPMGHNGILDHLWFGQICAGHDVHDRRCRHEFSDSNAWTDLIDFLRWNFIGLCVQSGDWTGAERSECQFYIHCCGCRPFVAGWYSTLYYTQCNHSPAWSKQ